MSRPQHLEYNDGRFVVWKENAITTTTERTTCVRRTRLRRPGHLLAKCT